MAEKTIKTTNLFIYGTLKRGCRNYHRFMLNTDEGNQSFYIGPHEIREHKVVILAQDIPGIIYTGQKHDVVVGELHAIQPKLLDTLVKMERGYELKPLPKHYSEIFYFIEPVKANRNKDEEEYYNSLKKIPLDNEGKFNYTPALNEKLLAETWGPEYAAKAHREWTAHLTPRRDVA